VAATNAGAWQGGGARGAGVKVAVIDLGFAGYATAQASGDLPASVTTEDYCGGQLATASDHGTAVAEIAYKMAPAAALYLICFDTEVDLASAEAYAKANGIQVIEHPVGWFNTSRGDGSGAAGTPDAIAADARSNGILWVNAGGNYALEHWSGTFSDNGSGLNLFAPGNPRDGVYIGAGQTQCAFLKWDNWPSSAQDYDLYLLDDNNTIVDYSENVQDGTQPPTEALCYTNPGAAGNFWIVIHKYQATAAPRFDLFLPEAGQIQYYTTAGSLPEPASSAATLAVGAVCWSATSLEPYSSQGPTIDGRIKPDLAGPDQVSTATLGGYTNCGAYSGFAGTSASSPHVAGAAALVKSANPGFSASQVQAYLQTSAQDLGAPGRDNQFGYGKLRLPPWPTSQGVFDVTGYFVPDTTGATYVPLTPTRLLDSRTGTGLWGPFSSHVAATFQVTGRGGVPSTATAVTGNLTVTQQTALGFIYLGPTAVNNPTSSTLNFPLGDDRANAVTVALGAGGTLSLTYASPAPPAG
ncbi:MAG TPA: S8 family serine peptidase, partial [Trebonia sp.]